MKKDIPVYIVLVICGIVMVYFGFTLYGDRGGYSALLSIGIIGYLIFKDFQDKKQAEKEKDEANKTGKRIMTTGKKKDAPKDISSVAKKSTKNKHLDQK
jgi:hypothetical protein